MQLTRLSPNELLVTRSKLQALRLLRSLDGELVDDAKSTVAHVASMVDTSAVIVRFTTAHEAEENRLKDQLDAYHEDVMRAYYGRTPRPESTRRRLRWWWRRLWRRPLHGSY